MEYKIIVDPWHGVVTESVRSSESQSHDMRGLWGCICGILCVPRLPYVVILNGQCIITPFRDCTHVPGLISESATMADGSL